MYMLTILGVCVFCYFTTLVLPSGAFTVNFLGEGVENQLRRNQLTKAPKPTVAHCDNVISSAIF